MIEGPRVFAICQKGFLLSQSLSCYLFPYPNSNTKLLQMNLTLIYGIPGAGKTTIATKIRERYGIPFISADAIYLDFVKSHCPELHFPHLSFCIGLHYDHILIHSEFWKERSGRDFKAEWERYLIGKIKEQGIGDLVVEGYLLKDSIKAIERAIPASITVVEMVNFVPVVHRGGFFAMAA